VSWYVFVLDYMAAKWPYASPKHRRGIAEALTDATEVMLTSDDGPYSRDELRHALRTWAFSARLQGSVDPPRNVAPVLTWLEHNTVMLAQLADDGGQGTAIARRLLDRLSREQDGTLAAANTANRKRMVINNALGYACETGVLPNNPVNRVKWRKPRTLKTVDPRVVINAGQARRLLQAIGGQGERGKRLVAFFACMYYAALRPEEAIDLRRSHLVRLPDQGWGEMQLTHSEPRSGSLWTDSGKSRERREL
jgi:integrase